MNKVLIGFRLTGDEATALMALSARELRDPSDQVRYMLRAELERRGLLKAEANYEEH